MPSTLRYHNFSWKGDPRWAEASRITIYAPIVVVAIFILSLAQIALGVIWIVTLQQNLTGPNIIQTILLPGLSFFNALPSLHLHLLLRSNPPILAIWFSSIFAILYLTSSIFLLVSCSTSISTDYGLRQTECARDTLGGSTIGVSRSIWDTMVALSLLSAVLYACHAGMAVYVMKDIKRRKEDGIVEDPEKAEARAQKARDLWVQMTRNGNAI
ncbi:MAG: hypothetical protein M1830_000145 [Pleopsidium flavum]|nr:MAG: hypothetical protein M1830_000145 [Pleopsidium flavum]